MKLELVPIDFAEACLFVKKHHRHHRAPVGHKFSIAVARGGVIIGVAIIGRPVARGLQDGWTLEVTRLATDGTNNACTMLYGAARRAAFAMGYRKVVTYILKEETGTTLRAAGWKIIAETKGRSWSCKSRPRIDKHPLQQKIRYEIE